MNSLFSYIKFFLPGLLVLSLSACSGSLFDRVLPDSSQTAYKTSRTEKSLDVPPDLSKPGVNQTLRVPGAASGTATYSGYTGQGKKPAAQAIAGQVLPAVQDVKYVREGGQSWLVIKAKPELVWGKIRQFWIQNGFLLTLDKPELGIMETEWAENRANIPKGPIRNFFGKVFDSLYESGLRDKYRVRLEKGAAAGTSELIITHRGMKEVILGSDNFQEGSTWVTRPSDPELEVEMLKRMMVFLGLSQSTANQVAQAPVTRKSRVQVVTAADGHRSLVMEEDFSRAWRYTGMALDRVGFSVIDRNRSKGIYYVRYKDPEKTKKKEGILAKLKFWSSDDKVSNEVFQVRISSKADSSMITVHDKDGKQDKSSTAMRILKLLNEQLK
jgi:outer membrane protein assembly factor BamC